MSKKQGTFKKVEYGRTPLQNVRTKNTLGSQTFPLCNGGKFALYNIHGLRQY